MIQNVPQMIEAITLHVCKGNEITAGLALAVLRRVHDANQNEFPLDEQTWPGFVAKHLTGLGYDRVQDLIGRVVHFGGVIRCTKCEAEVVCRCGCGAPYLPENRWAATDLGGRLTAFERAASSIKADPTRSNRAIAKEIGVCFETVARARRKLRQRDTSCVTGKVPSAP